MDSDPHKLRTASALPLALTVPRAGMLLVCIGALLALGPGLLDQLAAAGARMRAALLGSGIAAVATALGTLPIAFSQKCSKRTYDSFLGFGAGVMLGATAFSLVIPALAAAKAGGASPRHASLVVGAGLFMGAAFILLLGRAVSPERILADGMGCSNQSLRRAWLFVSAVTLHNLPEGLAMGVAYGGIDAAKANSLATGISIQDVPEGLVVALALRTVGYSRVLSTALGVASGIVEPIAAAFGVALIGVAAGILPLALAGAAGAMLFVIVNEMIPEMREAGNGTAASVALIVGFILMTVLDTAL